MRGLGRSLGVPRGSLGVSQESLGVPEGVPRGAENGEASLGASWDGPGGPLGWFWRYLAILGSVVGGQSVAFFRF